MRVRTAGQGNASLWMLPDVQGKGPVRQNPSADGCYLDFWLLLDQAKSNKALSAIDLYEMHFQMIEIKHYCTLYR
jgi:hypothetical protein